MGLPGGATGVFGENATFLAATRWCIIRPTISLIYSVC